MYNLAVAGDGKKRTSPEQPVGAQYIKARFSSKESTKEAVCDLRDDRPGGSP